MGDGAQSMGTEGWHRERGRLWAGRGPALWRQADATQL